MAHGFVVNGHGHVGELEAGEQQAVSY
ncbi:hypothetical protein MY4824_001626 [Beauveria thailandica]